MPDTSKSEAPAARASLGEGDSTFSRSHQEKRYMIELGHRLRSLREERGLTQQALARAAGIATDMVSRLENGHYSSPGLRTLLRIADGMGLPVSALLPDVQTVPHSTPEGALRARLAALVQRIDLDDLELVVDIAGTIISRRRH
jgi:transcriptional regulator with XRE-family HTH domain